MADTPVIGAGRKIGNPSIFRHPGDPYSRTEIERVELRVDRVEREDWLQVTTVEQV